MDWVTIIVAFISALSGGGLLRLLTVKEGKQGKQLENKEKEADLYLKLIDELQDQIENLNARLDKKDERITELEDINASLRARLDDVNSTLVKASLLRCNRLGCERRSPPLGYTELTPEEISREMKDLKTE